MNIQTIGLVNIFYLFITPLAFTLGTGFLLWSWRHKLPTRSWQVAAASMCALFVAANYIGALSSQGQLEKLHKVQFGEIYHYYVGAKYYKELKNTALYRCTWLGFQELSTRGKNIPRPRVIRDLEITWDKENLRKLGKQVNTRCNNRFTQERWVQFIGDLEVLLKVRNSTQKWSRIFVDYGNNPPPTWNVVAGAVANLIPLSPFTLKLFTWFDLGLMLLLIPLVIWRVFGLIPAIGYVLLAGMQPLLPPGMDGAAYFRQIWLAALALGICALHARKFAFAGLLLGLSASMRIFPAIFAFGAMLPLLLSWQESSSRQALTRLVFGLFTSGVILLALSLMAYGPEHWRSFLMIIDSHANNLALNSIGYKRHLLSFLYNEENLRMYVQGARFTSGQEWYLYLADNIEDVRTFMLAYIGAILLVTGAVAIRLKAAEAAMLVGTICMFFLTSAYGYYYVFLPLLAVVWLTDEFDRRPMLLLLWLLTAYLLVAWYFPFNYPGLIEYYTAASNVLFTVLVGIVVTAFGFLYRVEIGDIVSMRQFRWLHMLLLAATVFLITGAIYTLRQT